MVSRNWRIVEATPDDVFAVLADGWLYPAWVVGATRMRGVDPAWPEQGSQIHHSLGVWPVVFDDESEIVEWSPPVRMRLRPKAGPLGRGIVVVEVRERAGGCLVRLTEEPVTGLASVLPRLLWAPLLRSRNHESLQRLAFLAEGRRAVREAGERLDRPEVPPASDELPSPQARADAREATDAGTAAAAGSPDEPHPAEPVTAGDPVSG